METQKFIEDVAITAKGDYTLAFKLLGFVVFVAQEGDTSLLSGSMISPRTYYRWLEQVQKAGYGDLLADARMRQALKEYCWQKFAGLPIHSARSQTLAAIRDLITEVEAPTLQASSRQGSETVKGLRSRSEGREAKLSALDG